MFGGFILSEKSVIDVVFSRRSIRRFKQKLIDMDLLKKFVDAARVAPSAANLQPLEYFIVSDKLLCEEIFDTIGWAGYITPKWTPAKNEKPVAYIVILVREDLKKYYKWDVGLAAQNIMLVAEDNDIGSCMLLNINRTKIRKTLSIPDDLYIDSIIALGYKSEKSVMSLSVLLYSC